MFSIKLQGMIMLLGCAVGLVACSNGHKFPSQHLIYNSYYLFIDWREQSSYIVLQENGTYKVIVPQNVSSRESITRFGVADFAIFGSIGEYGSKDDRRWFVLDAQTGYVVEDITYDEAAKKIMELTGTSISRTDAQLIIE